MLEQYHVILASNSPRRKELLAGLEIDFEVKTIKGLEEHFPNNLREGEIPLYLAKQKMRAYSHLIQGNELIITADTIVWKDNSLMGKPKTKEDAIQMLRSLSGDTHQVYTGVCVKTKEKEVSFVAQSDVRFATLTDEEITHYIERYKPFDKAGSYGVQEWIGYIGVEHINGSFYNIMGLPIQKLYNVLKEF
ncbi:MAG: septum formation protein Maf [Paludibacteraceae bacterium]|nr:septum formation protein Maf [Paludibacteraceae bacterium]